MKPVFQALVPALHIPWDGWWDSGSGDTLGGYDDTYGTGGTWT